VLVCSFNLTVFFVSEEICLKNRLFGTKCDTLSGKKGFSCYRTVYFRHGDFQCLFLSFEWLRRVVLMLRSAEIKSVRE
jgi:hypothetical protein